MTELVQKKRGRQPGSKNKNPSKKGQRKGAQVTVVKSPQLLPQETPAIMPDSKFPLDMNMNMAYPINSFFRVNIPTIEEIERNTTDRIDALKHSSNITKVVVAIASRNPSVIQSLEKNGIDPTFLDGGYNFTIQDIVVIERITGVKIF